MNVGPAERVEVAAALRGTLKQSGLIQADFARHLGTSATRLSTYLSGSTIPSAAIYLRALRLGAAFAHVRQQGLMTPDDAAEAVNRALAEGDVDFALRMILQARDDLRAGGIEADELRRVWDRRSRLIEDDRFDTLFRVIVALVSLFTGGVGVIAYIVGWIVIPEEGQKTSIAEDLVNKNRQG